jgi:ubiquinol-cytochrome c reductase cytochrome b subunit
MYSWHILLLPAAVVGLVVAHVLLVRKHGVVPPFELEDRLKAMRAGADAADAEGTS